MEFLLNNIGLVALVVISAAMLIGPEVAKLLNGGSTVTTLQAIQLINKRNAIVLDVREAGEYASGHITNSRHIPMSQLKERINELARFKARPIIVNCGRGTRSAGAIRILKQSQFAEVFQLRGGFAAWAEASLPLERT